MMVSDLLRMLRAVGCGSLFVLLVTVVAAAEPELLDDQFVLPHGFHMYRVAAPELTGGSYDLTFDGQGRLLVGDGKAVRRLSDTDGDQVYDTQVTIADGPPVAGRGPQGLLAFGDHLYVVAGDGVQLFSGLSGDGPLQHVRRLGEPFNTGGDHAAHTVLRGLDNYIYLVTGDGGGTTGRRHITESTSPNRQERAASVFRFDPAGDTWECIGSGGRNPPSLGMNYLGELFSFDSDMEFHVDVPFYRPVRLNHWATGVDLGWQGVGAFPPWYIDTRPGVLDVGRGSPNWGVVYEHTQLPKSYRDAFIVCDYTWKSATSGRYASSGRLLTFHLQRKGAEWQANLTELAKAKPNARDASGRPINFALVDVTVSPDGSLLLTDHNQGVWRLFYDTNQPPRIPALALPEATDELPLKQLLTLPQPAAEWSHVREQQLRGVMGAKATAQLTRTALDQSQSLRTRLRAIRLLAADFKTVKRSLLKALASDPEAEVRGQAAWLVGIRGVTDETSVAAGLLTDADPFVRRRAAEALMRLQGEEATESLVDALDDASRAVRYAAMIALTHRDLEQGRASLPATASPQTRLRFLVAAHLRGQKPESEFVKGQLELLWDTDKLANEDTLDLLRVLHLYRGEISAVPEFHRVVQDRLRESFPDQDRKIRWEQARLLGAYGVSQAFPKMVAELVEEEDYVTQFHLASSLAELPRPADGWDDKAQRQLCQWLIGTQTRWFAEFAGKGLQFPQFWATVVNKLGAAHADGLAEQFGKLEPDGPLAQVVFAHLRDVPNGDRMLIERYRQTKAVGTRANIVRLLSNTSTPKATQFFVSELSQSPPAPLRRALLVGLAESAEAGKFPQLFVAALMADKDPEILRAAWRGLLAGNRRLDAIAGVTTAKVEELSGQQAVCFRLLELLIQFPASAAEIEQTLCVLTGHQPAGQQTRPRCIWTSAEQIQGDRAWFGKSFTIPDTVKSAEWVITCDNRFQAYVNGQQVAASADWTKPVRVDIAKYLRKGENRVAVAGENDGGPAGLVATLSWMTKAGTPGGLATNPTWRVTTKPTENWAKVGVDDNGWQLSMDVSEPTKNAMYAWRGFVQARAADDALAIQEQWHKWYLLQFQEAFVARASAVAPRADAEIHALIAGMEKIAGNAERGRAIYLRASCYACHGGLATQQTTIFGPSLGGVVQRLKRAELADAIVYPSKHVVERFKASVVVTDDGKILKGFITERNADFLSVTDLQNRVTRLRQDEVESVQTQNVSLMPAKLLSRLTDEEIRDLLAFLNGLR